MDVRYMTEHKEDLLQILLMLKKKSEIIYYTIHLYSGITSGRVLNGELLYTKILEVSRS